MLPPRDSFRLQSGEFPGRVNPDILKNFVQNSGKMFDRYHEIYDMYEAERKENDSKRIDAYINRLLEQTVPYEETVETGKPLLDGLLSEKVAIAQRKQIGTDIRLDFSEINFIDDMALCTIFGNALDNAIEACEKVQEEDGRLIQVKSELDAGQLMLYFINSCSGPVSTVDGLPETTKADRQNHGIGLKHIQRALNRYNGTMFVKSSDNRFELILVIPCEMRSSDPE